MSNLSTSSRPRSLVAISTGRRRVLAHLADEHFRVERVTFLDDDVEAVEKLVDRLRSDASLHHSHRKVWIELGDPPGTHDCLVHTQVEDRCGHPIEIGQLQVVEVGKPQLTAQALCRKGVGNGVSHTLADDADAEPAEAVELSGGDQMSIAVKSHLPKCARTQNTYHGPAPGIVGPASGLGRHIGRRRGSQPLQAGLLLAHIVDELDPCVGSQFPEESLMGGIVGVENYCIGPLCIIDV